MSEPYHFSWVEDGVLAGMAEPLSREEFDWLRDHGVQVVVTLTENPPRRDWINDAGLLSMHEAIPDMTPPTTEQIERIMEAVRNACNQDMGVVVHCAAGMGRTGTILACWFVEKGMTASDAIAHVRALRPGSVETQTQMDAVVDWERSRADAP